MTTNTIQSSLGLLRILQEGYGPGAWHGPDLKAAVSDVTSDVAFWRPQPERHNIAEVALHHAYTTHSARVKLTGKATEAFALEGEDWFPAGKSAQLTWKQIAKILENEQVKLAATVEEIESGRATSPLRETEQLELLLGVTCHAVYHAGQVQLLKRLQA